MIADQRACFPKCQRCWRYDCRLFGESGEAVHVCSWHCISGACVAAAIEIEGESPEGKGGGKDVGVSEGALRVPNGIDRGENDRDCRDCCVGEVFCEFEDAEQGGGCDHADQGAGTADDVSGEMPPGGEEDRWEGRVGVGDGGLGDQGAGAEEVPGGGDVVTGFVPEVGEAEETKVRE